MRVHKKFCQTQHVLFSASAAYQLWPSHKYKQRNLRELLKIEKKQTIGINVYCDDSEAKNSVN